mmetsp:Transcript_42507/g.56084  ORF Transcript_42507/g.56084 Transcript_42507/m.56084 type:complete len:83 (-) Transcript_42507:907-1155(-)
MTRKNSLQNAVTYELSFDKVTNLRNVYNVLDYLSDIGGFVGAVGTLSVALINILQFRGPIQLLLAKLYETPPPDDYNHDIKG